MARRNMLIGAVILVIMALALMDEKVWGPKRLEAERAEDRREMQRMEETCWEAAGRPCVMPTQEQMDRSVEEAAEGITEMLRGRE